MMLITRKWAMPNKRTFTIKPIKELIEKYKVENTIDPFPYPYKEDVLVCLKRYNNNSTSCVLFDPPYSPRQLKECYDNQGMVLHDTKSSVWAKWKDEIARVIEPNGICISFGWSTNGLGKCRGFEIVDILLVAHGGNHNDTICVVEKKIQSTLSAKGDSKWYVKIVDIIKNNTIRGENVLHVIFQELDAVVISL